MTEKTAELSEPADPDREEADREDAHQNETEPVGPVPVFPGPGVRPPSPVDEYLDSLPRVRPSDRLWRGHQSQEVAAQLLRPAPPLIAITGHSGSGRTSLLSDVAKVLKDAGKSLVLRRYTPDLKNLDLELTALIRQRRRREDTVFVIDDFDIIADVGTWPFDSDVWPLMSKILRAHRDHGVKFLLVVHQQQWQKLDERHRGFALRLHQIQMEPLQQPALRLMVSDYAEQRGLLNGLPIDTATIEASLTPAGPASTREHPGLAIDRIDEAFARARLQQATRVTTEHMNLENEGQPVPQSASQLGAKLAESVRGQPDTVSHVAKQLAPALAGLKLRPERPHGVFLFTGPTGVGKTELAKQLAQVVYGTSEALIRVDMSEYCHPEDARFKLIGNQKSWRNSSREGLLTTKVEQRPGSLILLDEFEKSTPELWPLFLQLFDEGRLTDGWGVTVSFAETIIVLTSNLGVREATHRAAGFGNQPDFDPERQMNAVKKVLPPELFNRLTATVGFDPLSRGHIRELAALELDRAIQRFSTNGWQIEYDTAVIDWLAAKDYDPTYGARHLQRTIGNELLTRLADSPTREVRLTLREGKLKVEPLEIQPVIPGISIATGTDVSIS